VGGRESAETVRRRQLLWRKEHRKAWRQMRSEQKRRYYQRSQLPRDMRGYMTIYGKICGFFALAAIYFLSSSL
jgi:hypothetical protein